MNVQAWRNDPEKRWLTGRINLEEEFERDGGLSLMREAGLGCRAVSVKALHANLVRLLGHRQTRLEDLPDLTELPLSTAFVVSDGGATMRARYPDAWSDELRNQVRRRARWRCECCGLGRDQLYVAVKYREDGTEERRIMRNIRPLSVAHLGGGPDDLEHFAALCNRCHNKRDRAHQLGQQALSMAVKGTLTQESLDRRIAELREIAAASKRPLAALQAGGVDIVVALVLTGWSSDARFMQMWIPALERESIDDLRECYLAALQRLHMRGLVDDDGNLTRDLVSDVINEAA